MSIVVYKDGVLAADRLVTLDGRMVAARKIWDVRQKSIDGHRYFIGAVGDPDYYQPFVEWFQDGCKKEEKPKFKDDHFEACVISRHGEVYLYFHDLYPFRMADGQVFAMGSGAQAALGALEMESLVYSKYEEACDRIQTVKRAVQVAINVNAGCGLGIDVLAFPKIGVDDAA